MYHGPTKLQLVWNQVLIAQATLSRTAMHSPIWMKPQKRDP